MATLKEMVQEIVGEFTEDNLTLWHKENDRLDFSSRARMLNGLCSGLDFQIKNQKNYLGNQQSNLKTALESSNTGDVQDSKIQSLKEQCELAEVGIDEAEELFLILKTEYSKTANSEWVAYVKKDQAQLSKDLQTASRLEATLYLEKLAMPKKA